MRGKCDGCVPFPVNRKSFFSNYWANPEIVTLRILQVSRNKRNFKKHSPTYNSSYKYLFFLNHHQDNSSSFPSVSWWPLITHARIEPLAAPRLQLYSSRSDSRTVYPKTFWVNTAKKTWSQAQHTAAVNECNQPASTSQVSCPPAPSSSNKPWISLKVRATAWGSASWLLSHTAVSKYHSASHQEERSFQSRIILNLSLNISCLWYGSCYIFTLLFLLCHHAVHRTGSLLSSGLCHFQECILSKGE